jgi:2-furoyl-CoA dehydrogenase FAD binding subunit
MKPSRFAYFDPTTVAEALELLRIHEYDAKILAGGQSLIPVINFRLSAPACLIDINRILDLDYIRREGEFLVVGALARHRTVERSPLVRETLPLLTEAVHWIGHEAIRTRGTIGGSVVHADPAAELPVVLTALEASVVVESAAEGAREIPIAEYFVAYMTTMMGPADLLTAVRIPVLSPETGWAFTEISRRSGDFALVSIAVILRLDAHGQVAECRMALGGVGPGPYRATAAEEALRGRRPDLALFREIGRRVATDIEPDGDLHASVGLRRRLAAELTVRALGQALNRCPGGVPQ